jgi:hypothetical protein
VNQQLVAERLCSHHETGGPEGPEANNGSDHSIGRDIHWGEVTGVTSDTNGRINNVWPDAPRASGTEYKSGGQHADSTKRFTPAQTSYFHERPLRFPDKRLNQTLR